MSSSEWLRGEPAAPGWYRTKQMNEADGGFRRYWNGGGWSAPVHRDDPAEHWERAQSARSENDSAPQHVPIRVTPPSEAFPTCACPPGACFASADGKARGRVSSVSNMRCKACEPAPIVGATTAADLLAAAAKHMADRATAYDKPGGERSMAATVQAFNAIADHALTESEGWLFMELLKAVRDFTTPCGHADSQEDRIAYAALGAEARRAGR